MMMGPVNFVNLQKHRLKRCGGLCSVARLATTDHFFRRLVDWRWFVQPCSPASSIWRCSIIDGIDIICQCHRYYDPLKCCFEFSMNTTFDIALVLIWEALMMMGPVNFKIAIWSVACGTDGLIDGLMTGHCDFRRNMQGVLAMWQHRAGLVLLLHQSEVQHMWNRFDCLHSWAWLVAGHGFGPLMNCPPIRPCNRCE